LPSSIYLAPLLRRNSRRPQGAAVDLSRSTPGYRSGCIDLVRKEFKVDDHRTYLMGHSMGGAGTLYLAIKYPQRWAAAAALAPAAFTVDREGLGKIPKMPIMLVHGDMDTVVPVTVGRTWAEAMKSVPMKTYQYIEVPGGDHGTVIGSHQAEIFAFFAKHSR
jgi:pimeloyl-ACP methyl ester carboxylesterase